MSCKVKRISVVVIGLALVLLCMAPTITSQYFHDDRHNYNIPLFIEYGGFDNAFQYAMDDTQKWIAGGRFFPTSSLWCTMVYVTFTSLWSYKLFICIMTAASLFLFAYFIKLVSKSTGFALTLAVVFLFSCVQMTHYFDAYTAFHGLAQFVLCMSVGSYIFLYKGLNSGRKWMVALSWLIFLINLGNYEVSYALSMGNFIIIINYYFRDGRKKRGALIGIPFALGLVGFMGVQMFIGRNGAQYAGVQPSLNILKMGTAFAKQSTAALPLIYEVAQPRFSELSQGIFQSITPLDVLTTTALVVAFIAVRLKHPHQKLENRGVLLLLGVLLWFGPAALISLSARYQDELEWGIGHLPLFIERFGMVLLGGVIISGLKDKLNTPAMGKLLTASALAALVPVCMINLQNNRMMAATMSENTLYKMRNLVDSAWEDGLFDGVPDGATIVYADIAQRDITFHERMNTVTQYRYNFESYTMCMETGGLPDVEHKYLLRIIDNKGVSLGKLDGLFWPEKQGMESLVSSETKYYDYSGSSFVNYERLGNKMEYALLLERRGQAMTVEIEEQCFFDSLEIE